MVDDAGKRWLVAGNYAQMKTQMMMLKNGQKSGEDVPIIIQKSGGVKRNDKLWIHLYFKEVRPRSKTLVTPSGIIKPQYRRQGVISFRLMNLTAPTRKQETILMKEQVIPFGEKIKTKFGGDSPFIWHKGKYQYSYCEELKGIQFQLLVTSEAEAKRLTEQTLDIPGYSPDWKYLNNCSSVDAASRYPDTDDFVTVFGKRVAFDKERPIVDVTFQYALLFVPTIGETFTLYDRRGKLPNPFVPK